VATISAETVRRLAAFDAGGAPVTSCYLDVDGRTHPTQLDVQRELDSAVRRARLNSHLDRQVSADIAKIGRHVKGLDRHGVRSVAVFVCGPAGWFESHALPGAVTSRVIVNRRPDVRLLEEAVERAGPFGLLLVDRQRARMFVFSLGELVEHTEVLDAIERRGADARGELVKTRVAAQLDEQAHQHLRHAARLVQEVHAAHPFDRLVLSGHPDAVHGVEACLRPDLAAQVVERLQVPINASTDQIRTAALEAADRMERRDHAAAVARLRDAIGSGHRGVCGLAATLDALSAGRVRNLLVSQGYVTEGWRCDSCGRLAAIGRRCIQCAASMELVDDVVAEAIELALLRGASVLACSGDADLDVLGRIGAVLRY
jgi:peptide subunit release factor 1 (eRF1)